MKKYKLLIILTFICNGILLSQRNAVFEEDFLDNRNNWYEQNDSDLIAYIQYGKYIIQSKKEKLSSFANCMTPIKINTVNSDFVMETEIINHSDKSSGVYGFLWGAKDIKNFYYFLLDGNGYCDAGREVNGKFYDFKQWKKSSLINGNNAKNKITVSKQGNSLFLFINGGVIDTIKSEDFFGDLIGYYIGGKVSLEVESVTVKSEIVEDGRGTLERVFSTFLKYLMHALIIIGLLLMVFMLLSLIFKTSNEIEKTIRCSLFFTGIFISYSTKALGISISELIVQSIMQYNPVMFFWFGLILPTTTGSILAWYCIRSLNRSTNIAFRMMILVGVFTVFQFLDVYVNAFKLISINVDKSLLPNVLFIVSISIYIAFKYDPENKRN